VVDGSNESLYHADDEMHPLLHNFLLSQTTPKNLDAVLFIKILLVEKFSNWSSNVI